MASNIGKVTGPNPRGIVPIEADVFNATSYTTKPVEVGTVVTLGDGRQFTLCASNSDITMGDIVVGTPNIQAIAATYFGATTSAAPAAGYGGGIGDKTIQICVVTGTATIAKDEYAGGYLQITDGTGEGQPLLRIKSNTANAATGYSFITLYDGLLVALDNTSVGQLINPGFNDVATHTAANWGDCTTNTTEVVLGSANQASTAGSNSRWEYIWVCTKGLKTAQAGVATLIKGTTVIPAEDDDGSAQINVAGENTIAPIGKCVVGAADTIYGVITD